ncbi:MAG: DUF805 domain-containing protein [Pseudomonadota bacterium]
MYAAKPKGFLESIDTCLLEKYFVFNGRASRSEYWYFMLAGFLLLLVAGLFGSMIGDPLQTNINFVLLATHLFLFIPSLSVEARRLHDIGRSAWWILLIFVPVIGWAVLLIFHCMPGKNERTQFDVPDLAAVAE